MKDKIAKWYKQGLWNSDMVQKAVEKGILTQTEADEIINS